MKVIKKRKINKTDRVKEPTARYKTGGVQYAVIIERDEDGFFTAAVPALPGCVTQAKTMSELRKRVKDAIKLCLSVAKDSPDYQRSIEQLAYQPSFVGLEMVTV